ncbi:MAG: hypothetical protein BGO01_07590 [Armatimonadetes bacterium 55-13]|nr:hypothetical protein [Armatimonadota bacterium]OJU63723.1 MAG: hypothetical protein BGO01_07590 [Armatimonadetes bacterium 55-13]
MDAAQRVNILRRITCLALLSGMGVCPKLWIADHGFPAVPVLPLPQLPNWLTLLLVTLGIGGACWGLFFGPNQSELVCICSVVILIVFDINRFQPWVFQYLTMLTVITCAKKAPERALAICGFVLSAVYFWSGIHKINPIFVHVVFPKLLSPFFPTVPESYLSFGWVVGCFEALSALALFWRRSRTIALAAVVITHSAILLVLGPIGLNTNAVVWPWNLAMIAMAIVIFGRNRQLNVRVTRGSWLEWAVISIVGLLPVLNFVNRWDDYPSFALYTGRSRQGAVVLSRDGADRMKLRVPSIKVALEPGLEGESRLDFDVWAEKTIGVPPYPEPRVYQKIADEVRLLSSDENALLFISDREGRFQIFPHH